MRFNTRARKLGKKFEITIPSYIALKYGFIEGDVLDLTVNNDKIIVEKRDENIHEDVHYPRIVFSFSDTLTEKEEEL